MLYLIGGAPRVGKSTLAKLILERNKIAYVDADWIVHMLMFAAPQLGVKVFSDFNEHEFKKKAVNFYPFLFQFVKYNQPVVDHYVIEGDSFLPEHVLKLQKEFQVKTCFLGTSKLKPETLLNNPSKNDWWIKKLNSQQLNDLCKWIMNMSNFLEKECTTYKITYIDVAKNHREQIEKTYQYLTSK
ncbi:MAG: hypothetical protein Q7S61_02560 [bacterium]|nr:hypothetical protein [bacterium]